MTRLKPVRAENLCSLLLFNQLLYGYPHSLGQEEVVQGSSRRHDREADSASICDLAAVSKRCIGSQGALQALRKKMVLLAPFLCDQRLDRAAQLAVVALPSCADKVYEKIRSRHSRMMTPRTASVVFAWPR